MEEELDPEHTTVHHGTADRIVPAHPGARRLG
jgi:hypothetical protein